MPQKILVLFGFFIIMAAGCSDHGHDHNDNNEAHHTTPNKHDSLTQ